MHVTFLRIFIFLLALSSTCFAQEEVQDSRSQYSIKVQNRKNAEAIFNAKVTIILDNTTIIVFTDSDGFVGISMEAIEAGNPSGLIVEAKGYERYIQNYLNTVILSHVVQLVPEVKYPNPNRLGLAMGHTRFKNIDGMTYTLVGAAYMRRIISNGYLDLTIMTSLNVENTIESKATNTEIKFGCATSYSISYVQSVLLGKGFSLLLEAGFQGLNINDNRGNKLIEKRSLLVGGGFEYNYKRFFAQINLNTVIGDDKNLGHDLDKAVKIGINF